MTTAQLLGFILICLMITMVYYTTKYVSSVRFRGHCLYFVMVNGYIRRKPVYLEWLKRNKDYTWCVLLILSLCPMILALIEPFRNNKMFIRPEATLYINIFLWVSITLRDKWLYRKAGNKDDHL